MPPCTTGPWSRPPTPRTCLPFCSTATWSKATGPRGRIIRALKSDTQGIKVTANRIQARHRPASPRQVGGGPT